MASEYIATHSNRIYIKSEIDHPAMADMSAATLAPVLEFQTATRRKQLYRRDKTGFRSESPVLGPQRELVEVALTAYGTGWGGGAAKTPISPILESGLCRMTALGSDLTVANISGSNVTFGAAHNLVVGAAIAFGQELRFVSAVQDAFTVTLNAAFTVEPSLGAVLQGTAGVSVGDEVRTFSILDQWSPQQAVQRFYSGVIANQLTIEVNNDFLEVGMRGFARSEYDSVSGAGGAGFVFPSAPNGLGNAIASPIAGHIGQAIVGVEGTPVCTLTDAKITITNNIEARTDEFGCYGTKAFVLGSRSVTLDMTLFQRNDSVSQQLYANAVNNVPVPIMLQIGNQPGSMFGVYLPAVLFALPEFDDRKSRLLWRFQSALALGPQNDEIFIAQR